MTSHYLLHGDRVAIRSLRRDDRDEFTRLAQENADRHHPWLAPPRTDAEFDAYMTRLEEPVRAGFAICLPDTGAMVGYVSVNNIVQGAFRCGALGYGAFAHGRGLVTEGVGLAVRHAFGPLGLHRLEINAQPANTKSITVAKRLGFRLEGLSPDFLFIDGAWRDHERWAITAEMLDAA